MTDEHSRESSMDVPTRITSKGRVTVPKKVRDALGIHDGDQVVFRVQGQRAVLAKTPGFLELAGTIPVPAAKRSTAWDEVIRRTTTDRAAARR
ncbi:MAG TPA: AbrB/MazE/SpoVT family DNA-binding domain-containing protein [Acidimicrobiales bacterium]|nr:AbrB/MazE/SpoVT family DNA-binding domain-containing protein [Acidimicrobiales bacterium]